MEALVRAIKEIKMNFLRCFEVIQNSKNQFASVRFQAEWKNSRCFQSKWRWIIAWSSQYCFIWCTNSKLMASFCFFSLLMTLMNVFLIYLIKTSQLYYGLSITELKMWLTHPPKKFILNIQQLGMSLVWLERTGTTLLWKRHRNLSLRTPEQISSNKTKKTITT